MTSSTATTRGFSNIRRSRRSASMAGFTTPRFCARYDAVPGSCAEVEARFGRSRLAVAELPQVAGCLVVCQDSRAVRRLQGRLCRGQPRAVEGEVRAHAIHETSQGIVVFHDADDLSLERRVAVASQQASDLVCRAIDELLILDVSRSLGGLGGPEELRRVCFDERACCFHARDE